jgi:hypothetical protein
MPFSLPHYNPALGCKVWSLKSDKRILEWEEEEVRVGLLIQLAPEVSLAWSSLLPPHINVHIIIPKLLTLLQVVQ